MPRIRWSTAIFCLLLFSQGRHPALRLWGISAAVGERCGDIFARQLPSHTMKLFVDLS
jgi:hypothetical protein